MKTGYIFLQTYTLYLNLLYIEIYNLIKKKYNYNMITAESVKHGSGTAEVKTEKGWSYYGNGSIKNEITGGVTDNGSAAVTSYEYDVVGRLIKKTYPDGQSEQYVKDSLDRITQITYADGNYKKLTYNSLSYVTKETDEENFVTEHEYDVWGDEVYRKVKTSANGTEVRTWKTEYTVFGGVKSEESGDGRAWSYKYNNRWLLSEKTDPNGIKQTVTYDGCGRMTGAVWSKEDATQSRSLIYNPAGFMKQGTDNGITMALNLSGSTYNANAYGLVTGCKTTVGSKDLISAFSYDGGKRLSGITYPDSERAVFGYNGIGQLKTVGSANKATAYASNGSYDTAGHLTSLKAGNSLTRTESWNKTNGLLESYSWGISGKSANTLTWNNRGNITAQTKNGISYSYLYDKKNQLKEEKKGNDKLNSWTYDETGNRKTEAKGNSTAKTITCYTKSDLIKSDGTWNYNYDNNGNMVDKGKNAAAKTNGGLFEGWTFNATAGEVWKYEYDLCNRLVRVSHSNAGTNNLSQVTEYKYDFRDLMVCRITGNGSSAVNEYFAFDNEGKLIYTEKGTEKHEYIYANGKLWCEVVTKGTTKNTYYHHTDHLGTTVCITDSSGSVVWECEKEAFGTVKDKTDSSFTPNFTGKLLDQNTGLYYFNARWYDPDMGRFITEDPARDGRNWFVYCRNNPLVNIDFSGNMIYRWSNPVLIDSIGMLYEKSETFKSIYDSLALENNSEGKKLFVMINDKSANYAGNTQSQDSNLVQDAEVMINTGNGEYSNERIKQGTEVQAIIINIDVKKVSDKKLNLMEIIAEEFSHASQAARLGTKAWNKRAIEENKMSYLSRPEEKRAKKEVAKIIGEVKENEKK